MHKFTISSSFGAIDYFLKMARKPVVLYSTICHLEMSWTGSKVCTFRRDKVTREMSHAGLSPIALIFLPSARPCARFLNAQMAQLLQRGGYAIAVVAQRGGTDTRAFDHVGRGRTFDEGYDATASSATGKLPQAAR